MKNYKFAVIGNGLMGSAAGRYLSEWSDSVVIIGSGEPADHTTHNGVFSSHYDQGRLCRKASQDPVWHPVAYQAVHNYKMLEERSGIKFHGAVGRVHAARRTTEERQQMLDWIKQAGQEFDIDFKYFVAGDRSWKELFPMLDYPEDFDLFYEPGPAGYINPRQMLAAENAIAQQNGATITAEQAIKTTSSADGVEIVTASGEKLMAEKVLIACGAFTNFNNLLPEPIPLRFKTESMVWGTVSAETAKQLKGMPGAGFDIEEAEIDDPYMAPPLL
ncbi:MAG: FAD-dependent oxidoreductase, partial [Chloroflexota bacterium]